MEFKYGELYNCENGDILVVAHDLSVPSGRKIVKINKFIQEHRNAFQEYLDSYVDCKFNIIWKDKSGSERSTACPLSY